MTEIRLRSSREEGDCIDCDASDIGLGAVLSENQNGSEVVIAYCDVYVGGKVRVSEFMIFLTLQHWRSK